MRGKTISRAAGHLAIGRNLRKRPNGTGIGAWSLALLIVLSLYGCGKDTAPAAETASAGDPVRGRRIYAANCVACHATDPSRDGSLGPAIKGASRDLLEARILHAAYPQGYKPKRQSKSMPAYPFLKSSIPDLAAFLR